MPAAIVYAHLAERLGAAELVIPGGGVREGIVFDLLEKRGLRSEADAGVIDDALQLGRKFLFDEKHALHVARLGRVPVRPACQRARDGGTGTAVSSSPRRSFTTWVVS